MCEELLIIVVFECVCEWKRVVSLPLLLTNLSFELILIVSDIFSYSMPSKVTCLIVFVWKAEYFHSVVVEWVALRQIDNIECNLLSLDCIAHLEEVPLSMPVCIYVVA